MDKEQHAKYWVDSSEEDWISAEEICQKNERKHFALFIAHLSLEKLLKALYVKKFINMIFIYSHQNVKLN